MSQQYKLPLTGKQVEEKLENTILTPITASVGQTVKISAVDANGKPTAWEAVDFSEGGTTSTYTNQLPLATDTDRTTVYDGNGYIDGYRLSSSGDISAQNGMSATGFIPATPGQTIRIKGATPMQEKNNYIIAYKADNTVSKYASMAYDSTGWITPHDGWMKYENGIIIILLTSTMFGSDFNAIRFCSAQLSNDVIVTVDEKIIDAKPDWNQNDSTAPDYVKNRPFWTNDPVETVLFDGTVVNDDAPKIELIVGQEYTVTLDGVEYVLTAWDDGDDSVVIGSESIWWETDYVDTEPPFAVGVYNDWTWFYTINEGEEHTLRIFGVLPEVHKIDEKYLPDRIIGGIDTANYALGIATGAADLADGAVALASSVLRHYKANPIVYFTTTDQKTYTATLNGSSKAFLSGYVQYPAVPDNENTGRYATLYVNDIYVGIVLGIKYAVGNAVKDFVKIEIMDTLLCVETSGRKELTETTIQPFIAKYHGDFSEGIKTIKLVFNENDVVLSNDVIKGFGVYSTVA